ncbi:MAG: hypothetical protein ACTSPI_17120 [Candidatus Heimdallarchaeaceae archaeon]
MDIIIDTETVSEAGFDGTLIRPVETTEDGTLRYIDPNNLVGGTIGKMGVLYIGSKQIRIDAKRGNIVLDSGNENIMTLGRLEDGSFGIDVADGKIEGAWIVGKSITADQIKAGTITTDEIKANTIVASDIAAGTITTTEIAADTITADNIAADTITSTEIKAGTIVASDIATGTITADKMSVTTLSAITANLGTITAGSISGTDITLPYEALSDSGNLRWVNDNNKIWTDSSQNMSFKSSNGKFYFYTGSTILSLIDYATGGGTGSFNSYLPFVVGAGVTAGDATFQVGDATHLQDSSFYGDVAVSGDTNFNGDVYLNDNDLLEIDELVFTSRSTNAGGTNTLYVKSGELWFVDGSGTAAQIS